MHAQTTQYFSLKRHLKFLGHNVQRYRWQHNRILSRFRQRLRTYGGGGGGGEGLLMVTHVAVVDR